MFAFKIHFQLAVPHYLITALGYILKKNANPNKISPVLVGREGGGDFSVLIYIFHFFLY